MKKKTAAIIPIRSATEALYDAEAEKDENIIGKRIAQARKQKGMSIAAFSKYLENFGVKIASGGAGKWETGYSIPNAYQMIAICSALEIENPIPYFMKDYQPELDETGLRKVREYRDDLIASGKYRPVTTLPEIIRYVDMPVSNLAVSAGTGAFLDEENFDMISFPEDQIPAGADFGIRISGDSMEPVYHDGQIVWVQRCESVGIGRVGVFIYDGEGYLKIYREEPLDEDDADAYTDSYGAVRTRPVLESYNPAYPPRPVNLNLEFQVVGRAL